MKLGMQLKLPATMQKVTIFQHNSEVNTKLSTVSLRHLENIKLFNYRQEQKIIVMYQHGEM